MMGYVLTQNIFVLSTWLTCIYGATIVKPSSTPTSANISSLDNRSSISEVQTMLSCTFDSDLCSWTQSKKDDFEWTRHHGPTETADTGPSFDHSTGNDTGYYLYVESSAPRTAGQSAQLISPTIDTWNSNYMCFTMWYHAHGTALGDLKVHQIQSQFINKTSTLWSFPPGHSSSTSWREVEITIVPTGPFNIIIDGVIGNGYRGDIGIDDINILSGKCPKGTTSRAPAVMVG